MDRHTLEKRRKAPRSVMRSVWAPAFAAILVLYMIFVVKVNYYATTTAAAANGVGGAAAFGRGGLKGGGTAPPAREMQEKANGGAANTAPQPALMQAATPVSVPLRPEMKRPTRQPDLHVDATTAPPPTTTTPPPPTTPPAVKPTTNPPPVTKPPTSAPPSTTSPVETVPAAVAPIDRVVEETAKPVEAPVIRDLTQAPATIAAVPLHPTTQPIPATQAPSAAVVYDAKDPLGDRHETLHGYRQTMRFLANYKAVPGESLFLYFTCSDEDFNAFDWSSECADATPKVYDAFAKSPSTNRLVTIYAGSEHLWEYQNKFRNDRDLRVKSVPSIMKWHGNGGETSGMMITDTLLDEPLVRYLFKNTDQPDKFLNAAAMVNTKSIETVASHEAFQAKVAEYQREPKPRRPLYLLFVSGRMSDNNRPWCPYCRFSEMPLEYGFYAFAPPNARLLRVEVAPTYPQWKTPNKFNQDQALGPLRGVPAFFTMQELANKEMKFDRLYERFDRLATLQTLFATAARVHDE